MIYNFIIVALCIVGKCPTVNLAVFKKVFTSSFNQQLKCCSLNKASVRVVGTKTLNLGKDYREVMGKGREEGLYYYYIYPDGYVDIASAALGGHTINTNDNTYDMLSIFMHEFGHNLGFDHAALGDKEYGDTTGYMGTSGGNSTYPKKCFNSFNNFHIGWYDNCKLEVTKPGRYTLHPFLSGKKYCILKVNNYYIQYNRRTRCNADQGSRIDRVIVLKNSTKKSIFVSELYHNSVKVGNFIISDCNHNFRFVPESYTICVNKL